MSEHDERPTTLSAFGIMPNLLDTRGPSAPSESAPLARPAAAPVNASDAHPVEAASAESAADVLSAAQNCIHQAAAALASGGDAAASVVRARHLLTRLRGLLSLD